MEGWIETIKSTNFSSLKVAERITKSPKYRFKFQDGLCEVYTFS